MSSNDPADFGILLNLAFAIFKDELHQHMSEAGFADLGPSFGYVLRILKDGPQNLAGLAQTLRITPPGALKIVDAMVSEGYVSRRPDAEDGRIKQLALTDRGAQALAEARRFHRIFERRLSAKLGQRTAASARRVLEFIISAGGEHSRPRPV